MLISCFGPPSGYTQICLYLLRLLAERSLTHVDYLAVESLEQLKSAWATRQHPHVLFFSHHPDRPLVDMFERINGPFVIFVENVDDVIGFNIRAHGLAWAWSLRRAHQSLISISDLAFGDNGLVLRRDYDLSIRELLGAIARHFQLRTSEVDFEDVLQRTGFAPEFGLDSSIEAVLLRRWEHARPMGTGVEGISRPERRAMDEINAPLKALLAGKRADRFVWPQEIFISSNNPDSVLLGSIEMLGPARILSYGPYLHLPLGNWHLELDIEVADNFSGNRFEIDIVHGEIVAAETYVVPPAGRFVGHAWFEISDMSRAVELRIATREGAIEGLLTLHGCVVEAVRSHASEVRAADETAR